MAVSGSQIGAMPMNCVMLRLLMKAVCNSFSAKRTRIFSAWLCLLAAILLWSPLWAAALQANGVGCCDGAMCAAHPMGHHHAAGKEEGKDRSTIPVSTDRQAPMDCGHGGSNALNSCSMSCCHDPSSSFVTAIVFVVPVPSQLQHPALILSVVSVHAPQKFSRTCDLLSPPPRDSAIFA
jgi:hypothetical protein